MAHSPPSPPPSAARLGLGVGAFFITPRRACAARGQVIALGLDVVYSVCKKKFFFKLSLSEVHGFSSNLMASSTALLLGKSSWPSQILLVYRLGKASTTPETPTLRAPNHTPFSSRYIEHAYQYSAA